MNDFFSVRIILTFEEAKQYRDFVKKVSPKIAELLGVKRRSLRVFMTSTLELPTLAITHGRSIFLNSEWFDRHPDDYGTIVHEVAHAVMDIQVALEEENWIIEGLADYVREVLGYPSINNRSPKFDVKCLFNGYQYSAHFFLWIQKRYGETEIKEMSRQISKGNTFDVEKLKVRLEEYKQEQNRNKK
jgi:hypothetical protein